MIRTIRSGAAAIATAGLIALVGTLLIVSPAAAANGTITGVVTAAQTSLPVSNVTVQAYDAHGDFRGSAFTSASGEYSISLAPGNYKVQFHDLRAGGSLVSEWSGDSLFQSSAAAITVTDGGSATADAALATGGAIGGSVLSTAAVGLRGARAYAFDPSLGEWVFVRSANFDYLVSGTDYVIPALSPDLTYRVRATQICEGEGCVAVVPRWNGDAATVNGAPDISVTAGSTTAIAPVTLTTSRTIPFDRLSGSNRFTTSALVAQEYDPAEVDVVYIANGLDFPDALSAAPAAAHRGAPLLLTQATALPAPIVAALDRLEPSLVVVVGSTGSVSESVLEDIANIVPGAEIQRIGGANRYETSRLISLDAFGAGASNAWVASGSNFADALSAAPVAGHEGAPVILVPGGATSVDSPTANLLAELGVSSVDIAGGTGSVSAALRTSIDSLPGIETVRRSEGDSRYGTSQAINYARWSTTDAVFLATGVSFADALSGAALAGRDGLPMYLVPGNCVPRGVRNGIWGLTPESLVVLGGTTSVTNNAANLGVC